jgi:hypothetical protein
MPQVAEDIGIVGVSYAAPMTLQDAENAINWYIEVAEVDGAKEPIALLGTPGLNPVGSTFINGAVRGMWVLPGGTQFLFVVANSLLVGTLTVPATQNAIAQFSIVGVGTLLTNNGPVVIRDNGVVFGGKGGYAVIVDGQYGYYYQIAGRGTITFPGSVTTGSPIITLPGVLPIGLLISPSALISDSAGAIATSTLASIDYNTPAISLSSNATGSSASDTFTLTIAQFGQITDPGFLGADRIAFIEGFLLFNQPGSRTFYTTGPTAYTLTFPGSFFALKDSSTDNLVTLYENNREAWLVGERTSEVWFNSGGSSFSFARVPGVGPQIGCAAKHSIARLGPSLLWLVKNEQGENMVIMTNQYSWQRVSNHAVEHAIASYPLVSDAIGYAYEEDGHGFYVLIFPTADNCWVYDVTSSEMLNKPCWHQRLSYDPVAGVYHRHRSNCFIDFQNLRLVGDYQTGQIHQMSRQFYTDAGNPLRAQRRSKHVWDKPARKRIFQSSLQIEFTPGVGLQSGQGSSPQAMIRWSNDGGFTWSNEYWRTIGAAGATKNRMKINRLGRARDRVYEVNFSDPTPRDIIGSTLFGEAEEA